MGGVLPALLWIAFWLFEDRCEPEPKRYIFLTFVAGMAMVVLVLPLEQYAATMFTGWMLLLAWAATEEICKFLAAYVVALRSWVFDEPLDAIIYMVTAALGFSSIENALFLWGALPQGVLHGVLTEDLRFVGATLLHTLSSATIGVAIALSFYQNRALRVLYAVCGVVLAVALHTLFNFFILGSSGGATFFIFLCIWFGIVAILLLVERVKSPSADYC